MKKIKILIIGFIISFSFVSCEVVEQIAQMAQLVNCKFDLTGVNNVKVSGIALGNNMTKSNLAPLQLMQLTQSILQKTLPVTFNANVKIDNPNAATASMNKLDYVLLVDDKELLSGALNQKTTINAGSSTTVAIPVTIDLFKVLSGESADAILNLAFKLTGDSKNPSKLTMKVKPYIQVGTQTLSYPNYIDINHTLK